MLKTLACLKMGKKDQEEKEEMDEEEKETMTFVGWLGDKVNNYNKWKLQKRKGVTKGGKIDQKTAKRRRRRRRRWMRRRRRQ